MDEIWIFYIYPHNSCNKRIKELRKNKKNSNYIKIENGGWYIKMICEYKNKNILEIIERIC